MSKKEFPKDFLWGVAYSSHQVEGSNRNDWAYWEQLGKTEEKSGLACDSWNLYEKDHRLAEDLGCGAFRLSLEWSRIEPEEGVYSKESIEHYRKILKNIKAKGMKRVVTLWHWGLPVWFSQKYGWHNSKSVKYFSKYCKKVIKELGDEIDIFTTINEPTNPLMLGYLTGRFPPGKKSLLNFMGAKRNMIKAHKKCYKIVKEQFPKMPVGITQYCITLETGRLLSFLEPVVNKIQNKFNWYFFDGSPETHDYIGVNYYSTWRLSLRFPFVRRITTDDRWTDMRWGIYPQGLYDVCFNAHKKFNKPIYILENGLADFEDKLRVSFIREHLLKVHQAIEHGVKIRGYFYWSLLDNFEWNFGYWPRFGLVEMNYKTLKRRPRRSYYKYKKIIKNNSI